MVILTKSLTLLKLTTAILDCSVTVAAKSKLRLALELETNNSLRRLDDKSAQTPVCSANGYSSHSQFYKPAGLAFSHSSTLATGGVLYVADSGNGAIRNVSCSSGLLQ